MIIISPYARHGVFHQQTTNVSILSFMQRLWGLPPLTALNARQNDLMSAFDFHQSPLPAPSVPVAPADTIGFHGSAASDGHRHAEPGSPLTVDLAAETGGLSLDPAPNGAVNLTVTPPPGRRRRRASPARSPDRWPGAFTVTFNAAGYYRIAASGPAAAQAG